MVTCQICGGAGWLARPPTDPLWGQAIPCKCKIAETQQAAKDYAAKVLKHSDLTGSMADWTLDDFPGDPDACAVARQAIERGHGLYCFWSKFGTGKTGLMVAVVNAFVERGVSGLYISMPTLLDKLRHGYSTGEYDDLFNSVLDVPVLALDEFDRVHARLRGNDDGTAQSWAAEKVFTLFDTRYTRWESHLTLIATNRAPDQADSDPITSRLGDSLRCRVVHVQGDDMRPLAAQYERHRAA